MPKWIRTVLICGGIVAGLGVLGTMFVEDPDSTPSSTATSLLPFSFAASTQTAIWDRQNATPTPQCPSPAEARYIAALVEQMSNIGDSMDRYAVVASQAAVDPQLMLDLDWQLSMAAVLIMMKTAAEAVMVLPAPSSVSAISGRANLAAANVLDAVDAIVIGIDNFDADAISEGRLHMEKAGNNAQRLQAALDEFC